MTHETKIRYAILRELGWVFDENEEPKNLLHAFNPKGEPVNSIPELTLDLMHEAEKTLSAYELKIYVHHELVPMFFLDASRYRAPQIYRAAILSTAPERAIAFLATKARKIS